MTDRYVLDSYALLAYVGGEPSGERVRALLVTAASGDVDLHLSLINFGEVAYIVERRAGREVAQRVIALVDSLPVVIADADRHQTMAAAHIKALHPVAYADAFAAALACSLAATLVTGDPEFHRLEGLVSLEWLS